MAFSGATKKLQQVIDMADKLYKRLDELRQQLQEVRERVEDTNDRVERIERDLEDQQALLAAVAERQGIDVDEVLTESAIDEAETEATAATGDESQSGTTGTAGMDTPSEETGEADAEADETFE